MTYRWWRWPFLPPLTGRPAVRRVDPDVLPARIAIVCICGLYVVFAIPLMVAGHFEPLGALPLLILFAPMFRDFWRGDL